MRKLINRRKPEKSGRALYGMGNPEHLINKIVVEGFVLCHSLFNDKHILVVDDDMRNAFALSRLLGDRQLRVTVARSGAKAIETLDKVADIDLVLMDIMMPDMDGYETMQKIRAQSKFKNLPILALTAKTMKGDQEKCIAAGANDFLSKPVDADRLFSMLRVWLYR